jgi:hypothetical protein
VANSSASAANPWRCFVEAVAFGLDCQEVILRRLPRLARGDALAMREAQRMIAEKATTAAVATFNAAFAWPTGGEAAATAAVAKTYRSAVGANKRRLRR